MTKFLNHIGDNKDGHVTYDISDGIVTRTSTDDEMHTHKLEIKFKDVETAKAQLYQDLQRLRGIKSNTEQRLHEINQELKPLEDILQGYQPPEIEPLEG